MKLKATIAAGGIIALAVVGVSVLPKSGVPVKFAWTPNYVATNEVSAIYASANGSNAWTEIWRGRGNQASVNVTNKNLFFRITNLLVK